MFRMFLALVALGGVAGLTTQDRADDDAAAKASVEKHIKAIGGEEKLAKVKAATWQDTGKFFGLGEAGIEYTGDTNVSGPTKRRLTVQGEIDNEKFTMLIIVGGDKGWTKTGDEVEEMDKEELDEQKEQMFADWAVFVNPAVLKTDAFKLSPLGEIKVEDRPLVGVKASSKGHRDLNLYFDK
jgi:hypothetical protein